MIAVLICALLLLAAWWLVRGCLRLGWALILLLSGLSRLKRRPYD